jgi:hypothetical protein
VITPDLNHTQSWRLRTGTATILRKLPRFDLVLTATATVALPWALWRARFPFALEWSSLIASCLFLFFESVIVAGLLWFVENPPGVLEGNSRFWGDIRKPLLLLVFSIVLAIVVGIKASIAGTMFALVVLQSRPALRRRLTVRSLALPAAYFVAGIIVAFAYNNVLARIHFFGTYDRFFNALDARLFGITAPQLVRAAVKVLPQWSFSILNFIYYGMFAQLGATLILCGIHDGQRQALRFVGTVLTAYYLALIVYFFWPCYGPFYLDPASPGAVGATQKILVANAQYLWSGGAVKYIPIGYYVAFPSLHIAQPLIALWFVRRWKRIAFVLAIYDTLLVAAIIVPEWHYFVDLIGGVGVAGLAILATGSFRIGGLTMHPTPADSSSAWKSATFGH